ncbi:tRNA(His) guanylyltransferase 2-like isoform X3 [Rhodamnia argentea]|uniref:tRNA(His) guanylyltransferase n=1 Tax=Rhodamnia argentea TaxID=178133 RepID=A0ABM3H4R0_9MYRT|nr:tRNA(His) guanylyltransferase 2-like isoform X3 [Rhodamnia argentea]
MAKSKYEYVKSFEVEDEVMQPNLIIVRIEGCNFERFSDIHDLEKPNDEKALALMNSCAAAVLEEYPDIVFSYGFNDEYSFVFKRKTKFYQRRARYFLRLHVNFNKMMSLIVSFFSSVYTTKWKEFFPLKEMKCPLSFLARVVCCASLEVLQAYLAWRQSECHIRNLYNTCLWMLLKSGKSAKEALEVLEGTQKQEKNELLFQQFGINYRMLPEIFRQGSCIFMTQAEDVVKHDEHGIPIKRMRRKPRMIHNEHIAGRNFWNGQQYLLMELGPFDNEIKKIKAEYVRSFLFENKLMPSTWIVIRIDGCHFHSALFGFELTLWVTYSSFVLSKDSKFYQRQASQIVSVIVSFFSSAYVMKWKDFFPFKELKYPPSFDGRAVCYPSTEILQDYLAWRQVDCHINNQYNTCFWMLVKSGKSKSEAQSYLKGTQTREKNELLIRQFNIDYNTLPIMFLRGSSIFRIKGEDSVMPENGTFEEVKQEIILSHSNIIEDSFWKEHPSILC